MAQAIELLEARSLLAAADLTGGSLHVVGTAGVSESLTISSDGTTITINDPNHVVTAGVGLSQVDSNTVTVPRANVTNGLVVDLGDGDDQLSLGGAGLNLNVTVNGGTGRDQLTIREGTPATVLFDGGASTDSIVNRSGLTSAPTLVSVETNVDRPVLLVPGFGGTQAADLTPAGLRHWLLNRGLSPEQLSLEPLSNAYSDMERTLDNVGYAQDSTLFTVKWDWRTPVAVTNDSTDDGTLSDVTLTKLQNEQTAPTWDSGVSYLAWYLGQASQSWQTLTGVLPAKVDLVTHSTGGLLARSFIQSAGYVANDPTLDTLPEIHTLIQVGVPSQGSGQTFDLLNNDFGLKPAARILGRAVDQALDLVNAGEVIHNPDGTTITAALLAAQADPETFFIREYIATLQDLLSTEAFLDDVQDGVPGFRQLPPSEGGNSLLFDLNANGGLTAFGAVVDNAFIVFSGEAGTAQQVTANTGPDFSLGIQNEQVSVQEFFGHLPANSEVWFSLRGCAFFTSESCWE